LNRVKDLGKKIENQGDEKASKKNLAMSRGRNRATTWGETKGRSDVEGSKREPGGAGERSWGKEKELGKKS